MFENILFENYLNLTIEWFIGHGFKVLATFIAAFLIHKFAHSIIQKAIGKAVTEDKAGSKESEKKREDTLISIFHQAFIIALWSFAGLIILTEVGINTAPLIAGAGIVGLAFGFGGQYLIKDLISGFFVLLENQYRIGDIVCIGDTCGLVENINLRTTILRDLDGTVHHIPNGEIKTASNLSKYYSRINLDIGVSYEADLEKVIKVVNKVGIEISKDDDWKKKIISPPQFLRVNDFADSSINVKIMGDTSPGEQWEITGELRKRLKIAFDKEGIEIPFPQRVIHKKN